MTRKGPVVTQRYFCARTKAVRYRPVRQMIRSKRLDAKPRGARIEAEALFKRG